MEGLLVQQAKLIGLDLPKTGGNLPFGAVYAVGDNPASDIAGARAAGNFFIGICLPPFCNCDVMRICACSAVSVQGPHCLFPIVMHILSAHHHGLVTSGAAGGFLP